MTNEDILNWAIEAGAWKTDTGELIIEDMSLRDFADLVAKDERRQCAKLCDELDRKSWKETGEPMSGYGEAIRERT